MFKALEIDDKKVFDNFKAFGLSHSQYNFTNLFMWKHEFEPVFDVYDGFLCIVVTISNEKRALFPIGNGKPFLALRYILSCFKQISFVIFKNIEIDILKECFGDCFSIFDERDFYDYVYLTQKLSDLSGKRLHSKRNHLNAFLNNYSYKFNCVSANNISDCEIIERKWIELKKGEFSTDDSSYVSTKRLLDDFEHLNCVGGIIYIDGIPAAYSIGEVIDENISIVHIEKAIDSYRGIYTAINQMCAKNIFYHSKYINREEDMGFESLRKAKLSYYPDLMFEYKIARFLS